MPRNNGSKRKAERKASADNRNHISTQAMVCGHMHTNQEQINRCAQAILNRVSRG